MQFYCFYVYIYRMNVICFMMIIFFYLNEIKIIIESVNTPYVFVLGDFNADIQSDSVFGSELVEFCNLNKLDFIDRITLPSIALLLLLARPMVQHRGYPRNMSSATCLRRLQYIWRHLRQRSSVDKTEAFHTRQHASRSLTTFWKHIF